MRKASYLNNGWVDYPSHGGRSLLINDVPFVLSKVGKIIVRDSAFFTDHDELVESTKSDF